MNKKIIGLGFIALTFAAIVVLPSISSAYRGDATVKGPNYSVERHDAMIKVFETNDFVAWQKLMDGKGNASKVITKDNFARFTEMHKLNLEGNKIEAQKIRAELGLGLKNGKGLGKMNGNQTGNGLHRGFNK